MPGEMAITTTDVAKAKRALTAMQKSLRDWMRWRQMNDQVAAGTLPSKKLPPGLAKQIALSGRDPVVERALANQLYALLSELMPDARLPNPDGPGAAVQLASIALAGGQTPEGLVAQGSIAAYLTWPVLIVGGLLLAVTTAIRSAADVAKEKEHLACIQSGACTDYGFWLKVGGIAAIAFVAWHHLGLKERVRRATK